MDKKNIDYCINQILDTLRKTKSIYRTNKEETAFDRSIDLSEKNCERLRTESTKANTDQRKDKYKLMIYFAHSTMVMYSKTIISHDKMNVGQFMEENKDVVKRVFDEGLSIMQYELSSNQMQKACLVYLQSKYFPSSVNEVGVFQPNID